MAKELEKAVAGLKEAMSKGKSEHKGWALLRGDDRPVNGCYEARGYYRPRSK